MELYDGPIEVGMTFVWEPLLPHACEHIKVMDISKGERTGEAWIACRSWVPTSKVSGDYTGDVVWNEESRFREAVMLVPARVEADS